MTGVRRQLCGCSLALLGAIASAPSAPSARAGQPPRSGASLSAEPAKLPAKHILFDRIVAWIDGETISQNELFAEASLTRVWAQGDSALQSQPSEAELKEGLRKLVGDMLVAREARRVGTPAPGSEQTEREMALLLERFASPEAYNVFVRKLGIDDAFVLDSINRRLTCEQYLALRLRTRLLHGAPRPAASSNRHAAPDREQEREERYDAMVASYRQELWRTVPVRVLRASGALERVTAPAP